MKLILALLITVGAGKSFAASHAEIMSYSPDMGTMYTFKIVASKDDQWDSKKEEYPALSPKKAQQVAVDFMKRVPAGEHMGGWEVSHISLKTLGRTPEEWHYMIQFLGVPKTGLSGAWNGPVPQFDVPVRLNGKIPEWKATKKERRK